MDNLASSPDHFHSSDEFLSAVAHAYFPGRRWAPAHVSVGRLVFRVLTIDGKVIHDVWPFPFDYAPLSSWPPGDIRPVPFLRWTSLATVPAATAIEAPPGSPLAAPFADFAAFRNWDDYLASLRARSSVFLREAGRRRRNLERHLGPLTYQYHDNDPDALPTLLRWKYDQYVRTRRPNSVADPHSQALLGELLSNRLLTVATLRANGRLLAVNAGTSWNGRYYGRLTGYDRAAANFGPGVLLHLALLEDCFRRGHHEFDFLHGGHAHKWHYATHARLIGPIGEEPRRDRVARLIRRSAGNQLARFPRLHGAARAAERRLRFRS